MDAADTELLLILNSQDVFDLFIGCINIFDLVIDRKNPEQEFALLCTKLCLQRLRFVVWGEIIGLAPSDPSSIEPVNVVIKEHGASITPALKSVLFKLHRTVASAEVFVERFSVEDDISLQAWKRAASASLSVFHNEFEAARRAAANVYRSDKSPWKVTRWSVHDLGTFRALVDKIEGLIDTLDAITEPFGTLERQSSRLAVAIKSTTRDPTSARLIRDVEIFLKPSPLIVKIFETLGDALQPGSHSTEAAITACAAECSTDETPISGPSYVGTSLAVGKGSSINSTWGCQPALGTNALCNACSTISLAMFAQGFRHALNYDQVVQSSDSCHFCALMLDAYKRQKCAGTTAGMACDKRHRGRLMWSLSSSNGPGVRFGRLRLDSSHFGPSVDLSTSEESSFFKIGMFTRRDLQVADSPRNIRLLRNWLQECRSSHDECKRGSYSGSQFDDELCSTQLPFRIIDVGPSDGSQPPRLVTSDYRMKGRYLTLSHCWGKIPPTKTTMATLAVWHAALPERRLSKTFQDAIWLTRQLGERFLWIDSLCIVQDDPKDLAAQIGLMGAIFEQSYCTIAAVDAKGPNGLSADRGLFLSGPDHSSRITIRLGHKQLLADPRHLNDPYFRKTVEALRDLDAGNPAFGEEGHEIFMILAPTDRHLAGPINTVFGHKMWHSRGWVFQEKELSRRCIYFTEEKVTWKCNRYWETEQTGIPERRERGYAGNLDTSTSGGVTYEFDHHLRRMWQRVVKEYSQKKLSYVSDKAKALKGFEERLFSRCGATFRFGLLDFGPKRVLLSQLLWMPAGACRSSLRGSNDFVCPTWSWMMNDGGVTWPANEVLMCPEELCEVSFGDIEHDGRQKLRISGPSRHISPGDSIDRIPGFESERHRWHPNIHFGWTESALEKSSTRTLLSAGGDEIIGWVVIDMEDKLTTAVAVPFLQYMRQDDEEEPMCVEFLALAQVSQASGLFRLPGSCTRSQPTYQRVGRGRVLKNAFGWLEGCKPEEFVVV